MRLIIEIIFRILTDIELYKNIIYVNKVCTIFGYCFGVCTQLIQIHEDTFDINQAKKKVDKMMQNEANDIFGIFKFTNIFNVANNEIKKMWNL